MSMDVKNENDNLSAEHEIYAVNELDEEKECTSLPESQQPIEMGSTFMMEVLVCSMILWSFLFLMSNSQYKGTVSAIDQILSTKSHIAVAENIEEMVTEVFHELLW